MSLISDALKKAERERAEKPGVSPSIPYAVAHAHGRNAPSRIVWPIVAGGIVAVAVGAFVYLRNPSVGGAPRRPAPDSVGSTTAVSPARLTPPPTAIAPTDAAAPAPSRHSAADVAVAPAVSSNDYDLAGMTVLGANTMLSISRRSDRRSIWIPVGKTIGEITAVSYDSDTDRAVIRVNGRDLSVRMRDSGSSTGAPTQPAE